MKSAKLMVLLAAALTAGFVAFTAAAPTAVRAGVSDLSDEDCAKCHGGHSGDLARDGASHRDLNCSGCHKGHPPRSRAPLPRCQGCHTGESHYDKETCKTCHTNPHMPLRLMMSMDRSELCLECHASAVALIVRGSSLHSDLSCSECHSGHRQRPSCADCHDPHAEISAALPCTDCHRPHLPNPVLYGPDIPDRQCAACHPGAYELQQANRTGHGRRSCASCHQKRHRAMPTCSTCHGLPHLLTADARFENCHRCHRTAHTLEVWPEERLSAKGPPGNEEFVIPEGIRMYIESGKTDPIR